MKIDMMKIDIEIGALRSQINHDAILVKELMKHEVFQGTQDIHKTDELLHDFGEMKANITLAFRHLEDARMRLGKVLQAYDGGRSIYDRVSVAEEEKKPKIQLAQMPA